MAESNFMLFKRGSQGDEEDIWDDSALVKAYDRAISLAKEKVAIKMGLKDEQSDHSSGEGGSREPNVESPKKAARRHSWKVGDYVRSTYTEDGIVYEAIIEKINNSSGKCLVKYLGYENEEEVSLNNLEPSGGANARRKQLQESSANVESSDDMEMETPYPTKSKSQAKTTTCGPDMKWRPVNQESIPRSSNIPTFPGFPDINPSSMPMPPPPPPSLWETNDTDSDSLYAMLMSWYMAGYHTGYYQGVQKQAKQKGK